jgi:hypothetical protein
MDDARQIAVAGYRQVLEDGPDVCDSESDSEHSDHGEDWSYPEMCTPDMLDANGKRKSGGPQQLSAAQVLALRAAAQRTSSSVEPTTQSSQKPLSLSQELITQASSRPLAPLNSDGESTEPPKDLKKRRASAKRVCVY